MKTIHSLFVVLVFLLAQGCATVISANSSGYTLQGNVKGLKIKKVYLSFPVGRDSIFRDSAVVKGNAFTFSGKVVSPVVCLLFNADGSFKTEFWLENAAILVTAGSKTDITVTGSQTQNDAQSLKTALAPIMGRFADMDLAYKAAQLVKDTQKIDQLTKDWSALLQERANVIIQFVREHPNSFVSLDELPALLAKKGTDVEVINKLFNAMNDELKCTADGKKLEETLLNLKRKTNNLALDFTQPDVDGNPIKLSDYIGKYVLLDFWASWCAPCRAENPNVLAAYNKYHAKGLEILAVSLDTKKEDWLKAVADDKLPWKQVSDLLGWKNVAARMYSVGGIPDNFLIAPDGTVVARRLRGADLEKKLAELFK